MEFVSSGFPASVIALAFGEAQLQEELHQIHEMLARAAEGVVVVVAPAQSQPVLAVLLDPTGAVAALPVGALSLKEELAGEVAPDEANDAVQSLISRLEPFGVFGEVAGARAHKFSGLDDPA